MVRYSGLKEDEVLAVRSIARGLSYFARERVYGYVDRIANAFSIVTLRQVLTEFLRDLKSEQDRGADAFMPSAKDVETFLKIAERDLSIAKVVASLALAYSWTPRKEQEVPKEQTGGGE